MVRALHSFSHLRRIPGRSRNDQCPLPLSGCGILYHGHARRSAAWGGGPQPTPAWQRRPTRPLSHKEMFMRKLCTGGLAGLLVLAAVALVTDAKEKKEGKKVAPVLNFKMKSLDGKDV